MALFSCGKNFRFARQFESALNTGMDSVRIRFGVGTPAVLTMRRTDVRLIKSTKRYITRCTRVCAPYDKRGLSPGESLEPFIVGGLCTHDDDSPSATTSDIVATVHACKTQEILAELSVACHRGPALHAVLSISWQKSTLKTAYLYDELFVDR